MGEQRQLWLVPFTGGVSSYAALWHALCHGPEDDEAIWLCYVQGRAANADAEAREVDAITRAACECRNRRGLPLWHKSLHALPQACLISDDGDGTKSLDECVGRMADRLAIGMGQQVTTIVWGGRPSVDAVPSLHADARSIYPFAHASDADLVHLLVDAARLSWRVHNAVAAATTPTSSACLPMRVLEDLHSCSLDEATRGLIDHACVMRSPLLTHNCWAPLRDEGVPNEECLHMRRLACASCVRWATAFAEEAARGERWLAQYIGGADVRWQQLPHVILHHVPNLHRQAWLPFSEDCNEPSEAAATADHSHISWQSGAAVVEEDEDDYGDINALGKRRRRGGGRSQRHAGGGFNLEAVIRRISGDTTAQGSDTIDGGGGDDSYCFDFDDNGSMYEVQAYDEAEEGEGGVYDDDDE